MLPVVASGRIVSYILVLISGLEVDNEVCEKVEVDKSGIKKKKVSKILNLVI